MIIRINKRASTVTSKKNLFKRLHEPSTNLFCAGCSLAKVLLEWKLRWFDSDQRELGCCGVPSTLLPSSSKSSLADGFLSSH